MIHSVALVLVLTYVILAQRIPTFIKVNAYQPVQLNTLEIDTKMHAILVVMVVLNVMDL